VSLKASISCRGSGTGVGGWKVKYNRRMQTLLFTYLENCKAYAKRALGFKLVWLCCITFIGNIVPSTAINI
jgi:hypothetical protein